MYITRRSNHKVKPNLHTTTIIEKGLKKQVTACTRCIKTIRKNNLIRQ